MNQTETEAAVRPIKPFHFDVDEDEAREFGKQAAAVLRSGRLILGEHTKRFEREFAEFVGVQHAISVNTGSSALEILLRIKGVEGKTVLVPTNTNFATVAAVLRAGGQVRYLDMDGATFAPTLEMVEQAITACEGSAAPLAGVLWVHLGGVVSPELPAVVSRCHEQGLFVLEDDAHAHGSELGGVQAGNLADGGAFSFFATKVMTTGEGGMITTNDEREDFLARSLRNQGKRGTDFGGLHEDFGNSTRITEIGALQGWMQMRRLSGLLDLRQVLARRITAELDRAGVGHVSTAHMGRASHYKLIVRLPDGREPGEVKEALAAQGVHAGGGVYELPCHRQPVFEGLGGEGPFPGAERWCQGHVCPPLTTGMTEEDSTRVGQVVAAELG